MATVLQPPLQLPVEATQQIKLHCAIFAVIEPLETTTVLSVAMDAKDSSEDLSERNITINADFSKTAMLIRLTEMPVGPVVFADV